MGQKPSTPSTSSRLPLHQSTNHNYRNAVPDNRMPAPYHLQHPERTSASLRRENSYQNNNANVNLRLLLNDNSNTQSNSTNASSVISNRSSSDNSEPNHQPEVPPSRSPPVYRASTLSSKTKVTKLPSHKPDISTHTPVAINTSLPKHVVVSTNLRRGRSNDLSNEEAVPPSQLLYTNVNEDASDCNIEKPIQSRFTTSSEERKKDAVINLLYPDLSGGELMYKDKNCVQEALAVTGSDTCCTQNKGQTSAMVKSINKPVFGDVSSNGRRQRIRNNRKQRFIAGRRNFHSRNTRNNSNFQPSAPELSDDDSYSFSETTGNSMEKSNSQFNEKIFVENVEVILNVLDGVSLETLNDVTKMMLKKLYDKLVQLHSPKVSDAMSGRKFPNKEFFSGSPNLDEGNAAELSNRKLEPEELFNSLQSVNTRYQRKDLQRKTNEDDKCDEDCENEEKLSEEEKVGKKTNVQHVFGNVYFCCTCEEDMFGQEAAASHNCGEESSSDVCKTGTDDRGSHQSGPSDDVQADTRIDIQKMWQEVNQAQKGRWYNISRLRDGTFQCSTCNVSVGSTQNVINHVRQKDHQQLLQRKRAKETAEERLWRQVPRKYKFNKEHFVVIKVLDDDIFMCKVCVCKVPITYKDLMSHIQAEEHVQEVRELRRK